MHNINLRIFKRVLERPRPTVEETLRSYLYNQLHFNLFLYFQYPFWLVRVLLQSYYDQSHYWFVQDF